jgi:hypothetical protein
LYRCIAEARKDDVVWVVNGLSTYVEEDRALVIQEAQASAIIRDAIPSQTFKNKYTTKLALSLLDTCSPEEERTIQGEIEEGLESEAETHKEETSLLNEVDQDDDEEA